MQNILLLFWIEGFFCFLNCLCFIWFLSFFYLFLSLLSFTLQTVLKCLLTIGWTLVSKESRERWLQCSEVEKQRALARFTERQSGRLREDPWTAIPFRSFLLSWSVCSKGHTILGLKGGAGMSLVARVLIAWLQKRSGSLHHAVLKAFSESSRFPFLPLAPPCAVVGVLKSKMSLVQFPQKVHLSHSANIKGRVVGYGNKVDVSKSIQSNIVFLLIPTVYRLTDRGQTWDWTPAFTLGESVTLESSLSSPHPGFLIL